MMKLKLQLKRFLAAALAAVMLTSAPVYAEGIADRINENSGSQGETFIYPEEASPVALTLAEQPKPGLRLPSVPVQPDLDEVKYGEPVAVSAHQKVYQLGAETYKTVITETPNTYTDSFGRQKLIDNTLVSKSRLFGGEYYTNAANDLNVTLPASMAKGQGITFVRDGVQVRLIPLDGEE